MTARRPTPREQRRKTERAAAAEGRRGRRAKPRTWEGLREQVREEWGPHLVLLHPRSIDADRALFACEQRDRERTLEALDDELYEADAQPMAADDLDAIRRRKARIGYLRAVQRAVRNERR